MGATTLKPGDETFIRLDLMMHPGMEGRHLFQTLVPLEGGQAAGRPLELYVRADFR